MRLVIATVVGTIVGAGVGWLVMQSRTPECRPPVVDLGDLTARMCACTTPECAERVDEERKYGVEEVDARDPVAVARSSALTTRYERCMGNAKILPPRLVPCELIDHEMRRLTVWYDEAHPDRDLHADAQALQDRWRECRYGISP